MIDDTTKTIDGEDYWMNSHYVASDETASWPKNWWFIRKENKNDKRKNFEKMEKRGTSKWRGSKVGSGSKRGSVPGDYQTE